MQTHSITRKGEFSYVSHVNQTLETKTTNYNNNNNNNINDSTFKEKTLSVTSL